MRLIALALILTLTTVSAARAGTLFKLAAIGTGLYAVHKLSQPKANMYCNGNDHLMHIFKNNDHVFKDSSGRAVPCNP